MTSLRYIFLTILLLISGCGDSPPEIALGFGIAQGPRNLDPRLATDAASERINRLLYRRLVEFDDSSRPVPGIADWEQLTPTHYRLTLGDQGRRFGDGSWLTAHDVAATYRSVLDAATGSPHRATLMLIERIEVLNEDQVDFYLDHADALFPAYLGLGILPASRIQQNQGFERAPLGSGSFQLVAWPEPGRLVLERRRDGLRIAFITVPDANVRAMKLRRGEVHLVQNDLPPELVGWLREQPELKVTTRPGVNFSYLGFNLEDPVTGELKLRQAIAYALDREAILQHLFQGLGRKANALLPPEHWAGVAELTGYAHDLDKARDLLQSLGYNDRHRPRLTYKTSSDAFRLRIATLIQAQLAKAGIDISIQSYDWGTFFGDIRAGRFQLFSLTWVGVRTPDIFRYVFHSESLPPAGANRGRYHSPLIDALIDQARAEPDLAAQAGLYRAIQAQLLVDLPYIPLWYEDQVLVTRAEVQGYTLAPDGRYDGVEHLIWKPQ